MSILNLPSPSTSIATGFRISDLPAPSSSIAAGLRVNALAKKEQSRKKQSSSTSTTRGTPRGGSDQLKKKKGFVSDFAVEPTGAEPWAGSAKQANVEDPHDQKDAPGEARPELKLLVADRDSVLKACIGTSVGLSLAGFLLRQLSHAGAEGGWVNIPDITTLMPVRTELWHVIPTVGVVALVASLRQTLIQLWPDFSESSRVANKQVLSSLKAVDFVTVSVLSGMSEEFLFRGALLPLLGPDWRGVLGAGVIFGALHVSGGRNASFAIWASFVGVLYGILGLYTCDLAAPMAAHSLANLLGAAIWKVSQNDGDSKSV